MDDTTTHARVTADLESESLVEAVDASPASTASLAPAQKGAGGVQGQRYDQMAKAASAGLMAHPHVETAIVEISGSPSDLVFHLLCTLVAEVDPSAVMELIAHGVIPNVERMLEEEFTSRDLRFSFAPEP